MAYKFPSALRITFFKIYTFHVTAEKRGTFGL